MRGSYIYKQSQAGTGSEGLGWSVVLCECMLVCVCVAV